MSFLLVLPEVTFQLVLLQVSFQLVLVGEKLLLEVQKFLWGVLWETGKCRIGRRIRVFHVAELQDVPYEAKCIGFLRLKLNQ